MGVADIDTIPDDRITASTFVNNDRPYYGRLNGRKRSRGVWCPKTDSMIWI